MAVMAEVHCCIGCNLQAARQILFLIIMNYVGKNSAIL